jgi:hypothetical protein
LPRNGSGSYSLPSGNPFIPSTVISSTTMNNTMSDLATALTQSIANDGQTTPVANLPMATFRHTNVGNAVARTDYAAAGQVQDSSLQWLTSIAGTDTITASITPSPTAYAAGQTFRFVPAGTNTTNVTLNINGLGAKAITKNGTVALVPGDLVGGTVFEVIYDGTQFQLKTAATATATSSYGVRGLVGANNAGTPNTKFDFSADAVTLRSTNGTPDVTRFGTGTITNDVGLAGSAANGRDQAGAFGASNWIHFYFIWNGTTLATLSSLTVPPTGPTLPTGYTHWAYAGAVFFNGSSQLLAVRMRGASAFYPTAQNVLAAGTATVETSIILSSVIPQNSARATIRGLFVDPTGAAVTHNAVVRIVTGQNYFVYDLASNAAARNVSEITVPNIGQQIFYLLTVNTTSFTVDVLGYVMPNGGE